VIERLKGDLPNVLRFLTSLHEGRKSSRGQVMYVVQRLALVSPDFSKLMDQQSTLPWRSQVAEAYPASTNPQSADDRLDTALTSSMVTASSSLTSSMMTSQSAPPVVILAKPIDNTPPTPVVTNPVSSAVTNPFSKTFSTTLVLVRVGNCDPPHKGFEETVGSDGLVVHRFHDDPSRASGSIHVDVFAHIMDLVLNHQSTKEVVGVIIENASRFQCIFEDIRNFFQTRSLDLPKLITLEKSRGQGTDGITFASNEGEAMFVVRSEIARRESELS
jgi:hypothetical protein